LINVDSGQICTGWCSGKGHCGMGKGYRMTDPNGHKAKDCRHCGPSPPPYIDPEVRIEPVKHEPVLVTQCELCAQEPPIKAYLAAHADECEICEEEAKALGRAMKLIRGGATWVRR